MFSCLAFQGMEWPDRNASCDSIAFGRSSICTCQAEAARAACESQLGPSADDTKAPQSQCLQCLEVVQVVGNIERHMLLLDLCGHAALKIFATLTSVGFLSAHLLCQESQEHRGFYLMDGDAWFCTTCFRQSIPLATHVVVLAPRPKGEEHRQAMEMHWELNWGSIVMWDDEPDAIIIHVHEVEIPWKPTHKSRKPASASWSCLNLVVKPLPPKLPELKPHMIIYPMHIKP